jgi:hypothetical protein
MNILPIDRALSIYGALANRVETKGARERLSKHLMKLFIDGEKDQHRLTVHGLSFLQNIDREQHSHSILSRPDDKTLHPSHRVSQLVPKARRHGG